MSLSDEDLDRIEGRCGDVEQGHFLRTVHISGGQLAALVAEVRRKRAAETWVVETWWVDDCDHDEEIYGPYPTEEAAWEALAEAGWTVKRSHVYGHNGRMGTGAEPPTGWRGTHSDIDWQAHVYRMGSLPSRAPE